MTYLVVAPRSIDAMDYIDVHVGKSLGKSEKLQNTDLSITSTIRPVGDLRGKLQRPYTHTVKIQ